MSARPKGVRSMRRVRRREAGETMKLYKVTCRGMASGLGNDQAYGVAYVVADDPERAYRTVRSSLDTRDLGFANERELRSVELIAEDAPYPSCGTILYLDA